MRITKITVSAGKTTNNPYRPYSNLRAGVTMEAEIEENDTWRAVAKDLREFCEVAVAQHVDLQLTNEKAKERVGVYDDYEGDEP